MDDIGRHARSRAVSRRTDKSDPVALAALLAPAVQALFEAIERSGKGHRAIALALGVTRRRVSLLLKKLRAGNVDPQVSTLAMLAVAVGVELRVSIAHSSDDTPH